MSLVIQTNNAAVAAQKNININNVAMNKALNRLSSGFRINSAADDAAGFAISSKLSAQGARLKAASQNASQASALVKTAEAGANQIQNMVVRLQTLAVQAASANNAGSLTQLDAERTKLTTEINKIANSTTFNGTNLLNGLDATTAAVGGTAATGATLAKGTASGISGTPTSANVFENAVFTLTTTAGKAQATGTATTAANTTVTAAGGGITTAAASSSTGIYDVATFSITATKGTAASSGTLATLGGTGEIASVALGAASAQAATANGTYTFVASTGTVTGDTLTITGAGGVTVTGVASISGTAPTLSATGGILTAVAASAIFAVSMSNGTVLNVTAAATLANGTQSDILSGASAAIAGTITRVTSNVALTDANGATVTNGGVTNGITGNLLAGGTAVNRGNAGSTVLNLLAGKSITFADVAIASQTAATNGAIQIGTTGATAGSAAVAGTVTSVTSSKDLFDVNGALIAAKGTNVLAATKNRPTTATIGNLTLTLKKLANGTAGTIVVTDVAAGVAQKASTTTTVTTSGTATKAGVAHSAYAGPLAFQVGASNSTNDQINVNLQKKYTTAGLSITGDLTSAAKAQTYMDTLKKALNTLVTQRADLGATANQLGFVQANLASSIEQTTASVSTIRDANIAVQMADFTKSKILVQAGTAMLAQANQVQQNVLRLFR